MPYPNIVYIVAAYSVTTLVIGAMIAAIFIDKRLLERELARLTRLSAIADQDKMS